MSEEEKKAIDELKVLIGSEEFNKLSYKENQSIKTVINLIEKQQKDIENWKKYCDEQENDITLKNNKICDLEFQVEKQQKEIEELKREKETNQQMIKLAETQILGYGQGYKDGLNKETTATEIVARERENQIIYEGIKHKINMEWVLKIRAKIEELYETKQYWTEEVKKILQSLLEKE